MNPDQPESPQQFPQEPSNTTPQPPYVPPQAAPIAPDATVIQQPVAPTAYPAQAVAPFPQNTQAGSAFPTNPQPVVSAPLSDETAKISKPKYWLSIIGVVLAYVILSNIPIVSSLLSVLWIVIIILCVRAIIQLSKTGADILSEKEKFKMVIYMALDPLISQALYYYILKKQMPATAKKALSIGWKTLGIQILFGVLIYAALVFVSYNGLSHKVQDKKTAADYSQQVQQTGSDITKLANNIKASGTSTLLTDCQTVKNDATKLQAIAPFSAKALADKVAQSNATLNQATNDCLTAANQSDVHLFTQSASEFAAWGNALPDIKTELAKL